MARGLFRRLNGRHHVLAAVLMFGLGGCGLHPLYEGGARGVVGRGLAGVQVSAIAGRSGWLMHEALVERLSAAGNRDGSGGPAPRYRLDIRLDDRLEGLGLLSNETVGRERRTLRARYQLIDLQTHDIVLDASAGSDAGIAVVTSEYATVAAEQTALENLTQVVADQIMTQVGVSLRARADEGAAPAAPAAPH